MDATDPILGDRVFVLLLLVHGLIDQVTHLEAGIEHSIGGPTLATLQLGGFSYRVTIEST